MIEQGKFPESIINNISFNHRSISNFAVCECDRSVVDLSSVETAGRSSCVTVIKSLRGRGRCDEVP